MDTPPDQQRLRADATSDERCHTKDGEPQES